jgi:iron complex outermembrane receptor protein
MRLSGGSGFKAPTIFVEEAEETGYHDVRGFQTLSAEKAQSISYDLNWKLLIADEIGLSLNTALFYTQLEKSLTVNEDSIDNRIVILENATGPTISKGFEFTAQVTYDKFKLLAGYTYNYITQDNHGTISEMELNPRHNLGLILMFEDQENGWRAGIENYYTGTQRVDRNPFRTRTPSYWLTGALVEKAFGNWRFYVNFENIFDTRYTKFDPTFIGDPFVSGNFRALHIYAPLEGRAINGGVRFVL